jgi:hypothetical protein
MGIVKAFLLYEQESFFFIIADESSYLLVNSENFALCFIFVDSFNNKYGF